MALNSLPALVRPANTEVCAPTASTTRRAILGAAILAPAIVACATSAVATLPVEPRTEWDRLVAAFRTAHAEQARIGAIHSEREGAWMERAAVIDQQRPKQPSSGPIDTSKPLSEIIAQTDAPEWKATWAAYEDAKEKFTGMRAAEEAAMMAEVEDLADDAEMAAADAFAKIKEYPAASLAMLAEKTQLFEERYAGCFEGGEAEALMADIQRLAAREA